MKKLFTHGLAILAVMIGLRLLTSSATLDVYPYYSTYDALAYFMELPDPARVRIVCAVDILVLIPLYASFLYRLSKRLRGNTTASSVLIALITAMTAADLTETSLIALALSSYGYSHDWLINALTASTPTKWVAFALWLATFLFFHYRSRKLL